MSTRSFYVFPIFIILFFLSSCASTEIKTYNNSNWKVNVNKTGCNVGSVSVTNNSSEMRDFITGIYVTNRNFPNRTFGNYRVFCVNIAPSETRLCETSYSEATSPFESVSIMGGWSCPDMDFSFR